MQFPPLFKLPSKNKPIIWAVETFPGENGYWIIQVTSGYVDGKKQQFPTVVKKGKNIGKSNETTIEQQANMNAQSLWNKCIKEGYVEDLDKYKPLKLPMLAKDYREYSHKMTYPAIVQPKLEGVRCFARKVEESRVVFISREGNEFPNLQYMADFVVGILGVGEELDGEIYHHGMDFEDITSLLKNPEYQEDRERLLKFHVYDLPTDKNIPTSERITELERRFSLLPEVSPLELVHSSGVDNEEEMYEAFTAYVESDYEGIIIRNKDSFYEYGRRSYGLMKYKEFLDEEFEILGVKAGEGKFENQAIFTCRSKINPEESFEVVAKGKAELKEWYLQNGPSLVGKQLTVQYQRLTKYGLPYLPVGIAVRDYE